MNLEFFLIIKTKEVLLNYKITFTLIIHLCSLHAGAVTDNQYIDNDTSLILNEIQVTAIKQGANLQNEAVASTVIGRKNIEQLNIVTVKNISDIVPNFFIPDYGSRMTSSIYVRGLGARIDQPVVGLNIDNVPIINKDNYDFDLIDIDRVEMLRGPQSTLYGRNTMAGIINIYTLSPLSYQGLRILGEYSSGNSYKAALSYYTKLNENFGLGFVGSYSSTDGFFKNKYNDTKADWENQYNGRFKTQWKPSANVKIENTFSVSSSRQGGYPYAYLGTGDINYNDPCFYNRTSITDGLTVNWTFDKFNISSITSYQHIDDNMTLDQDFLPESYFTLTQARKENAITQDFVLKGKKDNRYKWLAGLFGFYKNTDMDAPVTFKEAGVSKLIEEKRNEINPEYPIYWDDRNFLLNSKFGVSNYGIAAYHQSSFKAGNWDFTAGIRFDYEHSTLDYRSWCNSGYSTFDLTGVSPALYRHDAINLNETGTLYKSFFEILPKFSALFHLPLESPSNIYASIAKGYKAGGFNTQMFSDVLQQKLMMQMGVGAEYDINDIVGYKPEKSWTYEVGAHIECFNRKVQTDISLFYIDCTDQQLTVFPDGTTTGRIMTNAGHTRSFGAEVAIKYRPTTQFELNTSYGYTNAKFIDFDNGKENFAGNYIPYAPQNTVYVGAAYTLQINKSWLNNIAFNLNMRGIGEIYWDEANSVSQPFYTTLGASITFRQKNYSLDFWGQNITNTKFDTFYFVSMNNAFVQRGEPHQFGTTLRINI